jgi:hypothetical protein
MMQGLWVVMKVVMMVTGFLAWTSFFILVGILVVSVLRDKRYK